MLAELLMNFILIIWQRYTPDRAHPQGKPSVKLRKPGSAPSMRRWRAGSRPRCRSFLSTTATGETCVILERDSSGRVTYVKTRFGKGNFYLHSNPLVFTNYHILYNSSMYPSRSLAYLTGRPLVWDEYYKPTHIQREGSSPLRYIFQQKALRMAYFLFLATWIIFVFFVGKRRQRIIPVYEKPTNQSLEFIDTVSQLYYNQHNNSDIVHKKIEHFADYVRSVLYLKFQPDDKTFRKAFAEKTSVTIEQTDALFDTLLTLQDAKEVSDTQLVKFIDNIDQFHYKKQS